MPAGAEPTGLTFTPDHKFGFFSVQHPDSTISTDIDATGNTIDYKGKSTTVVIALKNNLGIEGSLGTIDNKAAENTVTSSSEPNFGNRKNQFCKRLERYYSNSLQFRRKDRLYEEVQWSQQKFWILTSHNNWKDPVF
jgi:hypothetical protein